MSKLAVAEKSLTLSSDFDSCAFNWRQVADMRERVRVLGGRVASTRINVSDASR
jgi:hypothetical protein